MNMLSRNSFNDVIGKKKTNQFSSTEKGNIRVQCKLNIRGNLDQRKDGMLKNKPKILLSEQISSGLYLKRKKYRNPQDCYI